jgi:hypothetical protein
MKDERIDMLFDALRNEQASVQSNEVMEWLDHKHKVMSRGNWKSRLNLKTILLGAVCLFAALLVNSPIESNSNKSLNTPNKQNKAKEVFGNDQDSLEAVIQPSTRRTVGKQKKTDVIADLGDAHYFQPALISNSDEVPFPENHIELVNADSCLKINSVVQSKQSDIRDYLFILDSLKSFSRPAARFTMDEPDCYLQIYKDYVVISYRFRNRTYYSGGTIHREETQEIDGRIYTVFAFQADNNMISSNFGSRVFFGFREIENRTNDIEVLFFNQPWAPITILIGHTATQEERGKLMERSKSQE